jgi:hypothetical protein
MIGAIAPGFMLAEMVVPQPMRRLPLPEASGMTANAATPP